MKEKIKRLVKAFLISVGIVTIFLGCCMVMVIMLNAVMALLGLFTVTVLFLAIIVGLLTWIIYNAT